MYAQPTELKCPFCYVQLSAEAVRSYRPFSCPSCHLLIEPRPRFGLGRFGCLSTCAIYILGLILFGMRWFWTLNLGVVVIVIVIAMGVSRARSLFPSALLLVPYLLRTEPENMSALAEFLDGIAGAPTWTDEFDKKLGGAKRRRTFDDELENVAIELAELYRDMLRGVQSHGRRRVKQSFELDELRIELRAVARDLRIARG